MAEAAKPIAPPIQTFKWSSLIPEKPEAMPKWLKAVFAGPSACGKTTTAASLKTPTLAIDTQSGVSPYVGIIPELYPIQLNDPDKIRAFVHDMVVNPKDYEKYNTLLIDMYSDFHDWVRLKWTNYYKVLKSDPAYTMQGTDYINPNSEETSFLQDLRAIQKHVIICAGATANYLPGTYMKIDPLKPWKVDAPGDVYSWADVVIMFTKTPAGIYNATVEKCRLLDPKTRKELLPKTIAKVNNWKFGEFILSCLDGKPIDMGNENIAKAAIDLATEDQKQRIYELAEILGWTKQHGLAELKNFCSVDSISELNTELAAAFINHLEQLVELRKTA